MANRKLPVDLTGKPMTYREEKRVASNHARKNVSSNQSKKAWNFPFRDAFERIGIKVKK